MKISSWIEALLFFSIIMANVSRADELHQGVEFTIPYNRTNGAAEPFTPLVHLNGQTYVVWVDANFRPWVTQKGGGSPIQVPLDLNPDYKAFADGHHRFSMGIDKNGYLHVSGDMHGYPGGPDNNNYLPTRYKNQTIMYWKSNKPYDVSGGFTFAGGLNASTAIPGTSFNSVHFFNDNNYELYFTGMVRAYTSNVTSGPGQLGVGLYKYNAINKTWSNIGGYPDASYYPPSAQVTLQKVFFWEYGGLKSMTWFQNFWPSFAFDNNNNLHFGLTACINANYEGPTCLLYAMSKDGGMTWCKASGKAIPGLPLRGVTSAANCADIVVNTNGSPLLGPKSFVVPDCEGNACVTTTNAEWYVDPIWHRWNGSSWIIDISNSHQCWGDRSYIAPDGKMYFFYYDRVRKMLSCNTYSSEYNLLTASGFTQFNCISYTALKNRNTIYCLACKDANDPNLSVATFYFNNRPLPFGWNHTDIGTPIPLGGDADYYYGNFNIRSGGNGVQAATDSLHYVYTNLNGDGSIVARLTKQNTIRPNAVDGVMIRESLDPNSKCVMWGSSVGSGKFFRYRNATNGTAASVNLWNYSGYNWMKLTRAGSVFTAYVSADGINWEQIDKPQTISMNQNIYIGLMGWCSEPLTEIHTATLDRVTVAH